MVSVPVKTDVTSFGYLEIMRDAEFIAKAWGDSDANQFATALGCCGV